jgi:hypothetical protein
MNEFPFILHPSAFILLFGQGQALSLQASRGVAVLRQTLSSAIHFDEESSR